VSAQFELDATGAATVFGQAASSVASVEVVDSVGAVLGEAGATDGWFVLTLPADAASAAASLVAQSASGGSIDTVPIGPPASPTTGADTGSTQTTSTSG